MRYTILHPIETHENIIMQIRVYDLSFSHLDVKLLDMNIWICCTGLYTIWYKFKKRKRKKSELGECEDTERKQAGNLSPEPERRAFQGTPEAR